MATGYFNSFEATQPPTTVSANQQETMDWYENMVNNIDKEQSRYNALLLGALRNRLNNKSATPKEEQAEVQEDILEPIVDPYSAVLDRLITNLQGMSNNDSTSDNSSTSNNSSESILSFVDNNWDTIRRYMDIFMNDCGATIAEAAGWGGNMYQESKFDPNAKGDKKGGVYTSTGLFQMSDDHWDKFRKMCAQNNWDSDSDVSLLKYVHSCALKGLQNYKNASSDPILAMYWICNYFERPNKKLANYTAREEATMAIYNHLLNDVVDKQQMRPVQNVTGDRLVNYARSNFLGGKYLSGGKYYPQKGLDCSGLTYLIYKAYGRDIGLSTADQLNAGRSIGKDLNHVLPGDLIIVSTGPDKRHVEMVTGIRDGAVWTIASRNKKKGVTEEQFAFRPSAIIDIRRII